MASAATQPRLSHAGTALAALATLAIGAAGCAPATTAYHFRGPVVSSVRAGPMPAPVTREPLHADRVDQVAPVDPSALPARHLEEAPAPVPAPASREAGESPGVGPRPGSDRSPAATDATRSTPVTGATGAAGWGLADRLRARVGERDRERSDVQWAVAALRDLGVELSADAAAATTGAELRAVAEKRDALGQRPLPGDLIHFAAGTPDGWSLVGVVLASHERELDGRAVVAVEFVYLGREVVRRGYTTVASPTAQRDDRGRALNTLIRHAGSRTPRGARFLAGELLRSFIRTDRLSAR